MPVMKVDVRVGETVYFSGKGDVAVTMAAKSGQRSRLEIEADSTISIRPPKRASVRDVVSGGVKV